MGLYLNPGNDGFHIAVNDDIYIDKSELIAFTNQKLYKRRKVSAQYHLFLTRRLSGLLCSIQSPNI